MVDDEHKILKQRAEILAQTLKEEKSMINPHYVVTFMLMNEQYAIETKYIREVYPLKDLTIIPTLQKSIAGFINIRRRIIPIFDLAGLLELTKTQEAFNRIIVLESDQSELALATGNVLGVQRVEIEVLSESLPTLTGAKKNFLKGISSEGIIILDGEKIMTDENFNVGKNLPVENVK